MQVLYLWIVGLVGKQGEYLVDVIVWLVGFVGGQVVVVQGEVYGQWFWLGFVIELFFEVLQQVVVDLVYYQCGVVEVLYYFFDIEIFGIVFEVQVCGQGFLVIEMQVFFWVVCDQVQVEVQLCQYCMFVFQCGCFVGIQVVQVDQCFQVVYVEGVQCYLIQCVEIVQVVGIVFEIWFQVVGSVVEVLVVVVQFFQFGQEEGMCWLQFMVVDGFVQCMVCCIISQDWMCFDQCGQYGLVSCCFVVL